MIDDERDRISYEKGPHEEAFGEDLKSKVNRELLTEMWNEGVSPKLIGKWFGVTPSRICHIRIELGLPPREQHHILSKEDEERFRQMWTTGVTNGEIAKTFGISKASVISTRDRLGLKPRDPAEAHKIFLDNFYAETVTMSKPYLEEILKNGFIRSVNNENIPERVRRFITRGVDPPMKYLRFYASMRPGAVRGVYRTFGQKIDMCYYASDETKAKEDWVRFVVSLFNKNNPNATGTDRATVTAVLHSYGLHWDACSHLTNGQPYSPY